VGSTDFIYIPGEIGVGAGILLGRRLFRACGVSAWSSAVTTRLDGPLCRAAPATAGASGARRRNRHGLFAAALEERSPSVAVRAMAAALSTSGTRRAGGPGCPRPRGC